MSLYGRAAKKSGERAFRREKKGTLLSGKSGKRVISRRQAIAIGLSEARRKGAKMPPPPWDDQAPRRQCESRGFLGDTLAREPHLCS